MSKVEYIQDDNFYDIIVDRETGVNYISYTNYDMYGITPRLNADGTPYVSEVETKERAMLKQILGIVKEVE